MTEAGGPLSGRIALVTGASRGIGRACALALAGADAQVIAVGRTQGALEALDDAAGALGAQRLTLVPMDLANGPGVDELGHAIFQRHRRLDILVHAAAMLGGLRPAAQIPPALWDKVVAVNLTAVFRLIRSLEPLLRASDDARAIFLTSGAAARPRAFWGSYAATKAGLEALVRCWADEVELTPIRAVIVDPGAMRTKMRAEAYPGEDPQSLPDPAAIGPFLLDLIGRQDLGQPDEVRRFNDWPAITDPDLIAPGRGGASPGRP